jgi:hypothetical protein
LLFLDVDNHEALGGRLYQAFNEEWSDFCSDYRDDGEFMPGDPFRDLVNEIPGALPEYEDESPAGCWGYQAFYIESPRHAAAAIKKFRAACVAWRKRWPRGSASATALMPPRRSRPAVTRGSARKPATRRR